MAQDGFLAPVFSSLQSWKWKLKTTEVEYWKLEYL